jgi:hypothetical protein
MILALCSLVSDAQDTVSYNTYKDIDKEAIYLEEFNNKNDSNWVCEHACYYGKVENGYYVYEVKKGQSFMRLFDVDIDPARNFEIEFVVNVPARKSRVAWSVFCWDRRRRVKSAYNFCWTIRQDGYMRLFHESPNGGKVSKLFEGGLNIKVNDYNKYTLRRRGGNYFFYVNEISIATLPYKPLTGRTLGNGAGAENKLGMAIYDYVKVSYLN